MPFAALLAIPEQRGPRTTQDTPEAAQTAPDDTTGETTQPDVSDAVTDVWDAKTPGQDDLTRGSNVDYMAEDAGFEPARVLTQHDFQSCALGHYANPPSGMLPEGRLTSQNGW